MPVSLDTIKSPRLQQGSAAGKGNIYIILYIFYIYGISTGYANGITDIKLDNKRNYAVVIHKNVPY